MFSSPRLLSHSLKVGPSGLALLLRICPSGMVAPLRDLAADNCSSVHPLAAVRSASLRSAPPSHAPPSSALRKVAPNRFVTVNPLREKESPLLRVLRLSMLCLLHLAGCFLSYGSKLASVRLTSLRSALARLAPLKSASSKLQRSKSAPCRSVRLRSAPFRQASCRVSSRRLAPSSPAFLRSRSGPRLLSCSSGLFSSPSSYTNFKGRILWSLSKPRSTAIIRAWATLDT